MPDKSRFPADGARQFERTALRETHEEVGIAPPSVTVLGALTPIYIPPTRFCAYPFVGAVASCRR